MKVAQLPKFWFYFLSFTWGLPMTLIGCIAAGILCLLGYRPQKWNYCWYFEIGEHWGGASLGIFFIVDKNTNTYLLNHEHGHSIQNCCYGLLMPFIVSIPSCVRYWYRTFKYLRKGITPPTDYYDIWFEGQASDWGMELDMHLKTSKF